MTLAHAEEAQLHADEGSIDRSIRCNALLFPMCWQKCVNAVCIPHHLLFIQAMDSTQVHPPITFKARLSWVLLAALSGLAAGAAGIFSSCQSIKQRLDTEMSVSMNIKFNLEGTDCCLGFRASSIEQHTHEDSLQADCSAMTAA